MSRFRSLFLFSLLFLLCVTPILAQSGLLRGSVVDSDGNPIEGVQITITSQDQPTYREVVTSDKRGRFNVRFTSVQINFRFELLFEKPGYQGFIQPMMPSAMQQMSEEFVMETAETQVVESHGDLSAVVTGSSSEAINAFNEGLSAQRERDLATARAKYEEAIAADPNLNPAHVALSQVFLDTREYEAAIAAAERGLELGAAPTEPLRVKMQALRALGRTEEADAVAAQLESAEGAAQTARRLYNEGGQAFQAEDLAGALEKFRKAAELDPSLTDAHHAVATLELANGNHEAAAAAAKKSLDMGSDDVRTLRVLYDAYDALGKTEELTQIAPRLAEIDPEFGGAKLLEQAAQLWNSGQTEKAVTLSKMSLAIDSSLAKAHYFIGLNHLSNGENAEARASLEKFIAMAPEDAEAGTAQEMLSYIE